MLDLLIIGAGPAGLSACLYASRAGLDVLVLDQGAPGGKLNISAKIENYPGQSEIAGPQLAYQMYEQALSFGGKQTYGIVENIVDHGSYKEIIAHDKIYQSRYVLIASGTKERKMNLEKEEELTGRGISYCAVCDGPFFKDDEVAVIGGGNSALEESLYLASICQKVHLIVRRNVFRADRIIVDRVLNHDKIEVHLKHSPVEILEGNKKVSGLVIQNNETLEKETLDVKGIFPFIGLDPITDFVSELKLTNNQGYIPTNEYMETKVKGIFAAGDVREKSLRQVVTAVNDGAIAGQYISSLKKEGNEDE